jgi:hypothetical protein
VHLSGLTEEWEKIKESDIGILAKQRKGKT